MQGRATYEAILLRGLVIVPTTSCQSCRPKDIPPLLDLNSSGPINIHLLPSRDQPLLHWRDTLLLLHAFFYAADFIVGLDIQFDLFAGKGADSS